MLALAYNVRSAVGRRVAALGILLGTAATAFVAAGTTMLIAGLDQTFAESGRRDVAVLLQRGASSEVGSVLPRELVAPIGAHAATHKARGHVGELTCILTLARRAKGGVANVIARGVTEDSLRLRPGVRIVAGRAPRFDAGEGIVGRRVAARLVGTGVDEQLVLPHSQRITIVGVFASDLGSSESELWVPRDVLGVAFRRQEVVSSVRVSLRDEAAVAAFLSDVEHDMRLGFRGFSERDLGAAQSSGASILIRILGWTISIFFAVAAALTTTSTLNVTIQARAREIAILRALGFKPASILVAFLLESVGLCGLGGLLGSALALTLAFARFTVTNLTTWSEVTIRFQATPAVFGVGVGIAVALSLVGGLVPAWRASRVAYLAVLRS